MAYAVFLIVLACVTSVIQCQLIDPQIIDPCLVLHNTCGDGRECRLVIDSTCNPGSQGCTVSPQCVAIVPTQGECRFGKPVIESQLRTPSCVYQWCPEQTRCNFTQNHCCYDPFLTGQEEPIATTTKPAVMTTARPVSTPLPPMITTSSFFNFGQIWNTLLTGNYVCPADFILPSFLCQAVVPPCRLDNDCTKGLMCCYTNKCGRYGCHVPRLQQCGFFDKILGLC